MPTSRRLIEPILENADSRDYLGTAPLPAMWNTGPATLVGATAAVTLVGVAAKRHVITGVYASFHATASGLLTIFDGTTNIELTVYDSAYVPVSFSSATSRTIAASLASGGASIIGIVGMVGYTTKQ